MSRIHPVFHIALLEKTACNAATADNIEVQSDDDQEYEVEEILDMRRIRGKSYYWVKWKGYSDSENTWEQTSQVVQIFFGDSTTIVVDVAFHDQLYINASDTSRTMSDEGHYHTARVPSTLLCLFRVSRLHAGSKTDTI